MPARLRTPSGPAGIPWDQRTLCRRCGGRYVPGYYRDHADAWHRPTTRYQGDDGGRFGLPPIR